MRAAKMPLGSDSATDAASPVIGVVMISMIRRSKKQSNEGIPGKL